MQNKQTKSCLVITYGPVPTPQYQTVEGGGMRAWGLAQGLKRNGIDVTIGVNNSFPQDHKEHGGVKLINWGLDDDFANTLNKFDAVLVSYCMGDPSVFIADRINDNVQLILDAYVPIYIEVSARESEDIETEYRNYSEDIVRFNKVLKRGDYFLCANEMQKTFYMGVLSSLGIINPRSYRNDRVLVVPFGIHDEPLNSKTNPYEKLGIKKSDFVVLWFGGLYPWFRVQELLDAMKELSKKSDIKFVFVGGKNPFNPNPDFFKQYEKTVSFAEEHKFTGKSVFFVDWVDFDDRVNWYAHSDLVISLNQPGQENGFSWRTRVMDYVWGELATLTNGGDPLSEELLAEKAALKLPELSSAAIVNQVENVYANREALSDVKKNVKKVKDRYYWHNLLVPVKERITEHDLPFADEFAFRQKLGLPESPDILTSQAAGPGSSKLHKVIHIIPKTLKYARSKGLKSSAKLAVSIARAQTKKRAPVRQRQYVFISHPMDNTGAPLVLIEIIKEFAQKYGGSNVRVITPMALAEHEKTLRQLGVKVDKAAHGLGFRLIRLQLGLRRDDFVLMNTIAIYDNYREFIMLWLKTNRLKHAYWFIHEDKAQIPVVNKTFLDKQTLHNVRGLIKSKKLTVLTPSEKTKEDYNKILDVKGVKAIPLRVELDDKYKKPRKVNDYKSVNFLLSGTSSDGRKGQMLALSAFYYFLKNYYDQNPKNYRDFKLHFIAIADDYLSQQIKWIGKSYLGERLDIKPQIPRKEALEISSKCNAVICCSLNETFGLYVAEGMFMGHVVLRNNSAGVDEQLKDGVNGYFIDHEDIKQFAGVIEKVLNKTTTSDEDLQKMGKASQEIIYDFEKNGYLENILNAKED